ncbi:MAG: glutamine-hydrolyzing carbamoyl-phosphate synthase small subunit [Acidobacteriota bacterium]|nr:glutamine-hydrolyzing carbamoyl-phosphate synthase small subunit [Acidobacteriota bacterium]MDH3523783.1 glutamine-hydrolyzing carbamoyl-phosphate synthase small subunit [Acidobacteriota bacterium]
MRTGLLLLEDGSVFEGRAVAPGTRFGEVVFNTSMTGYQEILTDPSYRGQIVVMTFPHIGNYGINAAMEESARPWVEGFVARRFTAVPSSHGSEGGLASYLRASSVPALDDLDTRAVVRRVREHGALKGVVTTERSDVAALARELADHPSMAGRPLVSEVTCRRIHEVAPPAGVATRWRLAVYDFGIKSNILRNLAARGAHLQVLPAGTSAADCLSLGVDGVVLSNGPGDPEPLREAIATVRELVDSGIPTFGICLGHQLLGLAMGGRTFKLKFGHHGGNQPVRDVATGRVLITSQNHGFAVDPGSLPGNCTVTEINLNDGTVEAFSVSDRPVYSAQYHPEAAPGPLDATSLFDRFLARVTPASAS